MADQFLFIFEPKIARRSPARDDERLCLQPVVIGLDPDMFVARIEIGRFSIRETRPKFFRLVVHIEDELGPVNSVRKSRVVFH